MNSIPKKKTLVLLRYRDLIVKLHQTGMSIEAITKKINHRLARLKTPTSISSRTISNWIKNYA